MEQVLLPTVLHGQRFNFMDAEVVEPIEEVKQVVLVS